MARTKERAMMVFRPACGMVGGSAVDSLGVLFWGDFEGRSGMVGLSRERYGWTWSKE